MAPASRHTLALLVAAPVLALVALGCSGAGSQQAAQAAGTAGETSAFATIQHSSLDVTVANQVGQPLVDVLISIKPNGRPAFTKIIRRMEGGQKRVLALSEFTGNDGSSFSLALARPKEITVTAVDLTGKKYTMTTPW